MKNTLLIFSIVFLSKLSFGQQTILPGDKSINKTLLKSATYVLEYSVIEAGTFRGIGNYKIEINYDKATLDVKTTLSFKNKTDSWQDHIIADGDSFKPKSITSKSSDRKLNLTFSDEISGVIEYHQSRQKTIIKERSKGLFFDILTYPYILPALPLVEGYTAVIPVYNYEALSKDKQYSNVRITGVHSENYSTKFSGFHKVWRVEVFEESTQQNYQYYIDQKTQKIWEIRLQTPNGGLLYLKNNEIDSSPLKNKFDKQQTMKLITQGKSSIKGQAFARDNKNGGVMKGMAVLNVNKKQFAPIGTVIVLIPFTDYFKEWNKKNESNFKRTLPPQPLDDGADECMLQTTVYDEQGHFEFTNLMPGEYLLSTSFIYAHDATLTTVVGRTDYFIDGNYQGSSAITNSENYVASVKAKIKKVVTIKKDGEMITVKLNKTK